MILILILCAIIVITSIFVYVRFMDGVFEKSSFSSGKLNDDPGQLSRGCRAKPKFQKISPEFETLCKNVDETNCDRIPACEHCGKENAYCRLNSNSCCPDYKCGARTPVGGICTKKI